MNELMVKENTNTIISNNENLGKDTFLKKCTLDLEKQENKIKLYNSLQKCDVRLNDIKGEKITITGLYIEGKNIAQRDDNDDFIMNEITGEIKTKKHYRTILFDKEGKTYVTTAYGVINSLADILAIFGDPTEKNPIKVKVDKKSVGNSGKESLVLILINE